jgi:hypothetical protein
MINPKFHYVVHRTLVVLFAPEMNEVEAVEVAQLLAPIERPDQKLESDATQ